MNVKKRKQFIDYQQITVVKRLVPEWRGVTGNKSYWKFQLGRNGSKSYRRKESEAFPTMPFSERKGLLWSPEMNTLT
jgi:hypothetical protein